MALVLEHQKKLLRVINYWESGDEKVIKELMSPSTDILDKYLTPFRFELNANLLQLESQEGKIGLLRHYIFEFWELQGFFKEYSYLFKGAYSNHASKKYTHISPKQTARKLDEFENYVIESHIVFDMAMNEIQLCCFKFGFDFYQIVEELKFSLEYFDSSVAHFASRKDSKSKDSTPSFEDIIKSKKLLSYLKENYKNSKPVTVAYMIFALVELGELDRSFLGYQTKLYMLLRDYFGVIGSRQMLNQNIRKLREPDEYHRQQIAVHTREISSVKSKK